jgi:hypothetical protein
MAEKVIGVMAAEEQSEKLRAAAPAMVEVVRKRCEEDQWSVESRRCMAGAASRPEARRCFDQLTPAQREAMKRADREEMRRIKKGPDGADGGAGAPPPPPAAVTAPAPPPPAAEPEGAKQDKAPSRKAKGAAKPRSQTTDPCEGGEGK